MGLWGLVCVAAALAASSFAAPQASAGERNGTLNWIREESSVISVCAALRTGRI